ncbi:MAG: alpha/beta fold hydrolase [Actinomycetota bacterium]|nr:alpha/beta fold hydrolase [Actinomycetota bacterium]MDP9486857.1 alpha/beta fold hydrolase [Actinomycetota bacterium]
MQNANPAIEERRVIAGELPTHYLTGGQGPPVVLLHGHGESSASWRWVLPALARTHRVYAPDFPGAGESAKPSVYSQPTSFYSDFLAAFLDTLGLERVALVAASHGGNTALRLALSTPDRVTALCLADSSGLGRVINPALIALTLPGYGDAAVAWLRTPLGAPQWVSMLASLTFAFPPLAPPAWMAYQYRLAQTPGHLQGAVACLRGELDLAGQREVFLDELPGLKMPTLVVWGTNDIVIPGYQAMAAVSRLENGRLVWIPNCGHLAQVERPDRFVAALGPFLADHAGDTAKGGGG